MRLPPRVQVHTRWATLRWASLHSILGSQPPKWPAVHGWQLEISLQAPEEQAGLCKLTLAQHPVSPCRQHRACGQHTGLIALPTTPIPPPILCRPRIAVAPSPPRSQSLDLSSRSGVEENDQFETTRDSGSSTKCLGGSPDLPSRTVHHGGGPWGAEHRSD